MDDKVLIDRYLLKSAVAVLRDLLEPCLMEVALDNDGRSPEAVYGGELAILKDLSEALEGKQ
jgi:hypothetical protein